MASKKKKSQKQKTATGTGTGKSIQKRKKAVSRRNDRWASAAAPLPSLVVRRPAPVISSKHTTYFEIVENTEKKKKLEFQVGGTRTVLSSWQSRYYLHRMLVVDRPSTMCVTK